ncbi:hypothetical protein [Desulfuribacillus stibiiarsenatis]|nr:hypothetical protein [Desulfuribacillus stibiiarsenatis]
MFQIDNNWFNPNSVIEKVEDVVESIYITQEVTGKLHALSSEDEEVLHKLADYFGRYPKYSGFPNNSIDENDIEMFVELRKNLRAIGWGMNLNYSSDWNELTEKANNLINSR